MPTQQPHVTDSTGHTDSTGSRELPDPLERMRSLMQDGPVTDLYVEPPSLMQRLRGWWTTPRALVFGVLTPSFFVPLTLVNGGANSPVLLGLIAVGAALSLTTYTPVAGQSLREVLGSPCATVGGVLPVLCAFSLMARPGGNAVLAIFLIGFGLSQRLLGSPACGLPGTGGSR